MKNAEQLDGDCLQMPVDNELQTDHCYVYPCKLELCQRVHNDLKKITKEKDDRIRELENMLEAKKQDRPRMTFDDIKDSSEKVLKFVLLQQYSI